MVNIVKPTCARRCPRRPEEGARPIVDGVTASCESFDMGNCILCLLQKQYLFLTAEPPLHPLSYLLKGLISKYIENYSLNLQIRGKHKLPRVRRIQTKPNRNNQTHAPREVVFSDWRMEEKESKNTTWHGVNCQNSLERQGCPLTPVQMRGWQHPGYSRFENDSFRSVSSARTFHEKRHFSHDLYNCVCSGQKCHGNYFLKALAWLGPSRVLSVASNGATLSFSLDHSSLGRAGFQAAFVRKSLGNALWMKL